MTLIQFVLLFFVGFGPNMEGADIAVPGSEASFPYNLDKFNQVIVLPRVLVEVSGCHTTMSPIKS